MEFKGGRRDGVGLVVVEDNSDNYERSTAYETGFQDQCEDDHGQ